MFTGIIEAPGKIVSIKKEKGNSTFIVESSFANELKEGQSVAHNGVCLTVTSPPTSLLKKERGIYSVTAIKETLSRTNLGKLKVGDEINLERPLKVGDRVDGHFVQGHVDTTAKVKSIKKEKGSWLFQFKIQNSKFKSLIIDKGSICINGVSLTVVAVNHPPSTIQHKPLSFSVAIIPHTFSHTNFKSLKVGNEVNIEFDILAKHIHKTFSSLHY
ncbi:MAG: riboflavin synthase [Bacteroidetes bacterium]|nr:riboflavin synthase [Bacteroidota bacterium]